MQQFKATFGQRVLPKIYYEDAKIHKTQQETSASDIATDKIHLLNANTKTPFEREDVS